MSSGGAEAGGLVRLGVFGAAHGVRGEVRLKSHTADPLAIASYGPLSGDDGRRFEIVSARHVKDDMLVVRVKGVTSRDEAERLTNRALLAPRTVFGAAEDDEFFHADLVGLDVVDGEGRVLGGVVGLHDFGAGPLVEIAPAEGGRSRLYPFTKAVVPTVDLAARRLVLVPPPEVEVEGERRGKDQSEEGRSRRPAAPLSVPASPPAGERRRRRGL